MQRRVAITGLGLVTSQGEEPNQVFKAWCEGQSGIGLHRMGGEEPHAVSVPYALCTGFDASGRFPRNRLVAMDRVGQLATAAATSAWRDAGLDESPAETREGANIYWGTGSGGSQTVERSYRDLMVKGRQRISPMSVVLAMNNGPASHIALQLGLGGECLTYSVACASSTVAVGEAFRRIRAGELDLAVAGGSEAALPFAPLKAWESMQVVAKDVDPVEASCRPFDANRQGLVLGEGAAALVLEDWDTALQRGARIYAEIVGYGASCDSSHLTTPDANGQLRALRQALKSAGLQPTDVQYVNAHGTATHDGDTVEIEALKLLLGEHASAVMVSSTKSMHGHLLGAAGAMEALATTLALHHGIAPPTAHLTRPDPACEGVRHITGVGQPCPDLKIALSSSFAFGGSNAVLALRAAST